MTEREDFDGLLDRFFGEGPTEIADDVIEASLLTIDTTAQRRAGFDPRRNLPMTNPVRYGLAAAAVLAVALLGTIVLPAVQGTAGRSPGASLAAVVPPSNRLPSAAPTTAASPAASIVPGLMALVGYPDTGTIVFSRPNPSTGGTASTWTINPDGTAETALRVIARWDGTSPETDCCAVLSADGKQVVVGYDETYVGTGTRLGMQILGIRGASVGRPDLLPAPCGGCLSTRRVNYVPGAWSSDGSLVAAEVWSDDTKSDGIGLAPVGGGEEAAMQVTGVHRDVPVAFSPDGSQLLFIRQVQHENFGVLLATRISATKGKLTAGPAVAISRPGELVYTDGYFGPASSWSPDGKRIAYAATDSAGSTRAMTVYVVDALGGTPRALAGPAANVTSARWSPDGNWIAYDLPTGGGAAHDEYVIRADGTGSSNLTAQFSPGVCCGRWAPDSSALLVAGTTADDEHSDLLVVPVNGDPIFQVTQSPSFYTDFSWGPASR